MTQAALAQPNQSAYSLGQLFRNKWVIAIAAILFFSVIFHLATLSDSPNDDKNTSPAAAASALAGMATPGSCSVSDVLVDKLRAHVDDVGYAHVTGRVTNKCAEATGVQLKLTIYGKGGEILRVADFWPASINNIAPGHEYPFEYPDKVEGFDKFTVEVIEVKAW